VPAEKPKRAGIKNILVDALLPSHPKIAALPSDAARWAYIVVLTAAKWRKPEGEFVSIVHLKACIGPGPSRHIEALKRAGLLDVDAGVVRVHDWDHYQTAASTYRVRTWRAEQRLKVVQ
jgi:hypothetical protein